MNAQLPMLQYQPASPKHLRLHQSQKKLVALFGSNRGGKTRWGMQTVLWHLYKVHPFHEPWPDPLRVRVCVTNEKQGMFQIMLPLFKELLPPGSWHWKADPRILEVSTGDGQTAEIEFLTYEQDVDKFGGVKRHIVWMDEEPRLRDQYWQNWMRTVDTHGKLILTMTPIYGMTWTYDEVVEGDSAVIDYDYITIYENKFLPLDEIKLIENNVDPDLKDAILYGRFISPTGLVYKDFDETVHVIPELEHIPDDWMVVLGADTHESMRNPQAVVFAAITSEQEFVIFDEILQPCLIPELAEMIHEKMGDWGIEGSYKFMVMDISQKSAVVGVRHDEVLKRPPCNIKKIRIADKSKGTPREGRSMIKDMLKWEKDLEGNWIIKPSFFVTENCRNFIWEIKRHYYDEWSGRTKDKRDPKEEVRKRDDHLLDCHDDQTEILTECGWKLFKDLNGTERVATLNRHTNHLEYQLPTGYVDREYSGKMLLCESATTNFCVTPTHRLYSCRQYSYKVKKDKKFELGTIDNFGAEFPIKKDALWDGEKQNTFVLPGASPSVKINMEDWLEFLGLYLAEGFTSLSHYQVLIAQSDKSKYFDAIQEILDRLPFNFKYDNSCKRFYCMNKALYNVMSTFGNSASKFVPEEVKKLSTELLKHLLYGLMLGDGTISSDCLVYSNDKYDSCSKRLIDDVQEVLLKIGQYGNVREYVGQEFVSVTNGKTYQARRHFRINFSKRSGYTTVNVKRNVKEIQYDGRIYCVSVPNGVIYTRRNGCSMWSGNSARYIVQENIHYRPANFRVDMPHAGGRHLIRGVRFQPRKKDDELWRM